MKLLLITLFLMLVVLGILFIHVDTTIFLIGVFIVLPLGTFLAYIKDKQEIIKEEKEAIHQYYNN
jgi:hypothetical protein